MSTIIQQFFEGICLGFEFFGQKQINIGQKIYNFFTSEAGIRQITKILTIVLLLVWTLYVNYVFYSDIYNQGFLYAFDNQFYINRYFYPLLMCCLYIYFGLLFIKK
jgi:hypothetical protein